ncbi:MAG: helix-turn-helix domain-containing protein [Curvibacter sp.]|nr:helix-turn-helix domain-containing protein [Curvibacter sp.]
MTDFTVLVLEGAYASSVAVTLDVLRAAAALAPRVGAPVPTWRVVSTGAAQVGLAGGLSLRAEVLRGAPRPDRSTWIVPGLGLEGPEAMARRLDEVDARRAVAWLRQHAGPVAASCSAVFLLQRAGLLQGRRVTTTWWLAAALQRLEPLCRVDADHMVCTDGPLTTAGAALAQADLMLHLLRERHGTALVEAVSRSLLIDARQAQAPFIVPEVLAIGDELVARLAARVERALPEPPSVAALASEFCVSERTLARRVRQATGKSPLALIQSVRLRRARTLLAGSRLTVEQVAEAVGYQDATALRRLMRKLAGGTPSGFRP